MTGKYLDSLFLIAVLSFCVFLISADKLSEMWVLHPHAAITQHNQQDTLRITPLRHPERVDFVLSLMTLEEKVGQMNLLSSGFAETWPVLSEEYREMIGTSKLGGVFNAHTVEHTLDFQRIAVEDTRLGIPLLFAFTPLFPFGYGLSYTTFEYDNLSLSESEISDQGELSVSVDITNSGDTPGRNCTDFYT